MTPALMSGPKPAGGQLQVPLRLCIDAGDEASRFDVWQVIHRRQPPLPADGDRYAIALGLALEAGGMTHVVNLLPRRDLRRRQRLRYVLLLSALCCWADGPAGGRTARLQRDFRRRFTRRPAAAARLA